MDEFILDNPEHFLIDDYFSKLEIKYFFNKYINKIKNYKIFLCPVNALVLDGKRVYKEKHCIQCGLCELKYISIQKESTNKELPIISDYLLTDLKRLSVALKYMLDNDFVVCEVKAEGNYRNKRIDIVYKDSDTVFLVKVLTDINSYEFYKRSYDDILSGLDEIYMNANKELKILTTSQNKLLRNNEHKSLYTINDIITKGGM